jgi:hypothetical protein
VSKRRAKTERDDGEKISKKRSRRALSFIRREKKGTTREEEE